MRIDSRHRFTVLNQPDQSRTAPHPDVDLQPEIAFLRSYHIDRAILRAASAAARREDACAARALIAYGGITASFYYQALAHHLGLDFVADCPDVEPLDDPAAAHRTGCLPLAAGGAARWLGAPEGDALRHLLGERRLGRADLAITTPAHLTAIIHYHAQEAIEQAASEALSNVAPRLSARGAASAWAGAAAVLTILCGTFGLAYAPHVVADLLGLVFFAGMSFRLLLGAAGLAATPKTHHATLADADLPEYTILVPLRHEAEIVPDLLAALAAIDYPRSKLEALILVEPEDLMTRRALASIRLPPWVDVIIGPAGGRLRTKPRALNIGLLMARGTLLTVYDAEDRPDADQLRCAAEAFIKTPHLACAQARLSIDNGNASRLARLFAIEYAALFDVLNVGNAALGLPLALGGTSNHFHTSTLRTIGGWDAWNVTEDADLGLRLAQLGHRVECLPSTTLEAAPDRMGVWMKQRRRWTKGWMQTFLVLARDAPRVLRSLGGARGTALILLLINLVIGPLLYPIFCGLLTYHLIVAGLPTPRGALDVAEATLTASVPLLGLASTLWCGYAGLKARQLLRFVPSLPLLLPYQLMISVAAWMGLADLIRQPYHWHKTVHHATPRGFTADLNRSSPAMPPPPRTGRRRSPRD